jgi:hypothetical protein
VLTDDERPLVLYGEKDSTKVIGHRKPGQNAPGQNAPTKDTPVKDASRDVGG